MSSSWILSGMIVERDITVMPATDTCRRRKALDCISVAEKSMQTLITS